MPTTRYPSRRARMVIARIAGLRPGTSPPPVRMAIARLPLGIVLSSGSICRFVRKEAKRPGYGPPCRGGRLACPARPSHDRRPKFPAGLSHPRCSMRTTAIALTALACAACATKNAANRPDSTAPAAATVAASPTSATTVAELRHAIDSGQARFIDAATKGDVAALGSVYTEDAAVLAPNGKAARGRAEIDKGNTEMLSMMKITALKLSTDDVPISGDFGVETG